MATVAKMKPSKKYSPAEWQARIDLAACYRLVAHHGMTDSVFTHISARVPGTKDHFLINPYGQLFHEITASSLVKIDLDGKQVEPSDYEVNEAGFVIHSAVHGARHDIACVLHTHTTAGMAVSSQAEGLLPLTQTSMRFYGKLAYHDFEGIALDLDERERLVRDLGGKDAMILKHHGLLTTGRTVAEAFYNMYYLEQACRIQITATQGGQKITVPSDEVAQHTSDQFNRTSSTKGQRPWAALRRRLDRISPDYAS